MWSTNRSAVAELRFALFHEGCHAFFLILGRKQRVESAAFKQQAFAQGTFKAAVPGRFRGARGDQTFLVYEDERLSFADFMERVDARAATLAAPSPRPRRRHDRRRSLAPRRRAER